MLNRLQQHARQLKTELHALALAARDPRTPWYAKALAALVVGYALSPLDLIPDPVPVLGYLDDLLLLPLGIWLTLRLLPDAVLTESRAQARDEPLTGTPLKWLAAASIAALWLLLAYLVLRWLL